MHTVLLALLSLLPIQLSCTQQHYHISSTAKSSTITIVFCCFRSHSSMFSQLPFAYLNIQHFSFALLSSAHITSTEHFRISSHASNPHSRSHTSNPSNPNQDSSSGTKHHHNSKPQDVFNHFHSLLLGSCSSQLHCPRPHDHGHPSTIRQSGQQPSGCRWVKLPVQSHKQLWWDGHQYGYWRLAEALFLRRISPWWGFMSSLSYHRHACNEKL